MKKRVILTLLFCFNVSLAFAHSGGTNSCGGHNDRKRGGYHVHNYAKHCACYPKDSACKKDSDLKTDKEETTPKKGKEK